MGLTAGGTRQGTITGADAGGSLSASFLGSFETASTINPTWSPGNLSPGSNGLLILAIMGRQAGGTTLNSVSIGGSNGTLVWPRDGLSSNTNDHHLYAYRQVSSGSNAITVTFSGSTGATTRYVIAGWLLTGNTSDTPIYAASAYDNWASPITHAYEYIAPHSVTFLASCAFAVSLFPSDITNLSTTDVANNTIDTDATRDWCAGRYTNSGSEVALVSGSFTQALSSAPCVSALMAATWV